VTVRPLRPEDREEWRRMRAALWPDCPDAEHREEIDAFLRGDPEGCPPLSAVFVCEGGGGRLAGFLELSVRNYAEGCAGPTPYVEGWYVDPEARRAGVGRALVRAAEEWARGRGYRELASDTELENHASQAAHAALGFEEVERAVHFRKPL
jgi:aminoglycoside 6'-N-acetyltransferase I